MKHQSVVSTNIASVGYDSDKKVLQVKFKTGSTYNYHGVPASKHRELLNSPSKGKFLNQNIKQAHASEVAA